MLPGHLSLPGGLRQPPGQEDGGGRGPRARLPEATSGADQIVNFYRLAQALIYLC